MTTSRLKPSGPRPAVARAVLPLFFTTLLIVAQTPPAAAVESGDDNWPSFRGPNASGVSKGPATPVHWDIQEHENIAWQTPLAGMGHSCPVIWGNRVFLTSAVTDKEPYLRVGLYGESPDHLEDYDHDFRVVCLDKESGEILWEKTAHRGKPKVKRHIKASHANCTPVTDGKSVVVSFGSEGLYSYDLDGNLKWKADLGYLDSGAFNAPSLQWGFASSPVIHKGTVIVQCDVNNQSYLATYDLETGKQKWRTDRDEIPGWGTPTIAVEGASTQILVNGYKHIGSYDFHSGKELWKLKSGGGDVPVPTPIVSGKLAYITNAHGSMAPMIAVRLEARGSIALDPEAEEIAWMDRRSGAYMQTPLVYGEHLYTCSDGGVLKCYDAATGTIVYRKRLGRGRSGFTASAVACADLLYYTSEDGEVFVIQAGAEYDLLARNRFREVCMATPAISDGTLFFRTRGHLIAISELSEESD